MSESDRLRWNARYAEGGPVGAPATAITRMAHALPTSGRALDVAGGRGRHTRWLMSKGLDAHLVDVSDVVAAAAAAQGLQATVWDLDGGLPPGPWDVILSHQFLERRVFEWAAEALTPGGRLLFVQPTTTNLERHPKPSARFLVAPEEVRMLAESAGLTVLFYEESWGAEGRHEARLVAEPTPR
jgi:tellurite methyltransferase